MESSVEHAPGSAGPESKAASSSKPRTTKTPLQKEVLEASYNLNAFPSEEYRRALGDRIELTEQQVQAWYINRRRRDKKHDQVSPAGPALQNGSLQNDADPGAQHEPARTAARRTPAKKPRAKPISAASEPYLGTAGYGPAGDHANGSGAMHGSAAACDMDLEGGAAACDESAVAYDEDYLELIEAAKATILGYREDGPPLGYYFDEPPSAADMPARGRKKIVFDSYLAEADEMGIKGVRKRSALSALTADEKGLLDPEDDEYKPSLAKKGRGEIARMQGEERSERERRKLEDRLERERAKEEAKKIKELEKARLAQERELKKLEALKEKERKAEEKRKALEEKKREKEMAKAIAHQDKQFTRLRQWHGSGPPDDLDLEWERLLAAAGYSEQDQVLEASDPAAAAADGRLVLARPEFPPSSLGLQLAFPPELGDDAGGEILMVWNFLYAFSDVLGLSTPKFDDLLAALTAGRDHHLLPLIHITLIRLLQADMEEAHAAGAALPCGPGNFLDRALSFYANMLEEAWGWGFDIDAWRAHLGPSTWPEVLRQVAIMAGAGPKRIKPQRGGKPKMGVEGEDVVHGENGQVTLRLPSRFGGGTVKAATWLVLSEAGAAGLTVSEIARRMQKLGLRDLKTTRTPEASLAGAMSRDVCFVRVAPSTFALQSAITYQRQIMGGTKQERTPPPAGDAAAAAALDAVAPAPEGAAAKADGQQPSVKTGAASGDAAEKAAGAAAGGDYAAAVKQEAGAEPMDVDSQRQAGTQPDVKTNAEAAAAADGAAPGGKEPGDKEHAEEDADYSDSDDEEEDAEATARHEREPWIQALMERDYENLALSDRLAALSFLVSLVVNGPTVRAKLDARAEESMKLKKQVLEDVKNDRKKKQAAEAAAKTKPATDDVQKRPEDGSADVDAPGRLPEDGTVAVIAAAQPNPTVAAVHTPEPAGSAPAGLGADEGEEERKRHQQEEEEDEQKRHQERIEALRKVDEENMLRMEPLGLDRRHNRYWRFTLLKETTPPDPNAGRIFVESADNGSWRLLTEASQLDALISALEPKGLREMELAAELERLKETMKQAMPAAPLRLPGPGDLQEASPAASCSRIQAERFLPPKWQSMGEEKKMLDAGGDPRLVALKQHMMRLEVALPDSAIVTDVFDRDLWLEHLRDASSPLELRSCLSELEASLLPGFLAKEFVRLPQAVRGVYVTDQPAAVTTGADGTQQTETHGEGASPSPGKEPSTPAVPEYLSWLPPTYAAIGLRLATLDASVLYDPSSGITGRDQLAGYKYALRPPVILPEQHEEPPVLQHGVEAAIYVAPVMSFGKIRPLQLLPALPGEFMCLPQRDFVPPEEKLRQSLAEAEEKERGKDGEAAEAEPLPWVSRPPPVIKLGTSKGKSKAGAAAAAAAAGTAAAAGAKGKSSARSSKNASKQSKSKSKKSALARELEAVESDQDYGQDYDDGMDDLFDDQVKYSYNPAGTRAAALAAEEEAGLTPEQRSVGHGPRAPRSGGSQRRRGPGQPYMPSEDQEEEEEA